jgi:hypothetical protein
MARKKLYYPEGQIQKGLYTDGNEWMLEDGTEYVGDYHTYYSGEVYTRSSYLRNVSEKLIPYINLSEESKKTIFEYDSLKKSSPSAFTFSEYNKIPPTEKDYTNGIFFRYFAKRHFSNIITEVDSDTFSNLKDEYYVKNRIPWKLTGPLNDTPTEKGVYDTNRRLVLLAEKDMEGIRNYVTNYTEYARVSQ